VAAEGGLRFTLGGHDHEVVAPAETGARAVVAGGPATTTVPYGTPVRVGDATRVLAHPAYPAAWERLRAWRTERARAAGKPPYVVFDDRTLRAIAVALPTTEADLLALSGVGPVKLETYGDEVLALADELRGG
jgi:superfamily II DNA helicase RecQ